MDLRDYLATRRSHPANSLTDPAPDAETLHNILKIASRVPDHGKLAPWRFIVISGEARQQLGEALVNGRDYGDDDALREKDLGLFTRAPLVVTVVSCASPHPKIPEWEQQLAAGAVCLNLIHAAYAFGFRAQWLTDWPTYDAAAKTVLGVQQHEQIAGFIHIGMPSLVPSERARPELSALISYYQGGNAAE